MNLFKKILSTVMATAIVSLFSITAFAGESTDRNIDTDPVDRSGQVIRIDIPNSNSTYTTLEGKDAQEWYTRAVKEGKQRIIQESELNMNTSKTENTTQTGLKGPFVISLTALSLGAVMMLSERKQKKR